MLCPILPARSALLACRRCPTGRRTQAQAVWYFETGTCGLCEEESQRRGDKRTKRSLTGRLPITMLASAFLNSRVWPNYGRRLTMTGAGSQRARMVLSPEEGETVWLGGAGDLSAVHDRVVQTGGIVALAEHPIGLRAWPFLCARTGTRTSTLAHSRPRSASRSGRRYVRRDLEIWSSNQEGYRMLSGTLETSRRGCSRWI